MNDKTKSKLDTRIEAEELKDEELENVSGSHHGLLIPIKGIEGESSDALNKTAQIDVTTGYKR